MFNIPMNVTPPMRLEDVASRTTVRQPTPIEQAQKQATKKISSQPPVHRPSQSQGHKPRSTQTVNKSSSQQPTGGGTLLAKGQKFNLSQINPNLNEINVCLGWDVGSTSYDLDTEAFMLGSNEKVIGDDWFVFYNQPTSPDNALKHFGDNKTGHGDGDDEIINIKLSILDSRVEKIIFVVTINEAKSLGYNFSGVNNAFIRVVDCSTNKELVRFNLTDYYSNVTSMMVGELYKKSGAWRFNPIGNGTSDDLMELCVRYGVDVSD